jgi:hypothetical protein
MYKMNLASREWVNFYNGVFWTQSFDPEQQSRPLLSRHQVYRCFPRRNIFCSFLLREVFQSRATRATRATDSPSWGASEYTFERKRCLAISGITARDSWYTIRNLMKLRPSYIISSCIMLLQRGHNERERLTAKSSGEYSDGAREKSTKLHAIYASHDITEISDRWLGYSNFQRLLSSALMFCTRRKFLIRQFEYHLHIGRPELTTTVR